MFLNVERLCAKSEKQAKGIFSSFHKTIFYSVIIGFFLLFFTLDSFAVDWYGTAGWSYRKAITVQAGQVTSGPHTNFPMLVNLTSDANLAANAQTDGDDILFTSSDGTTKLDHEIESYTSGTGALVAWVEVPSINTGTVIYMYYGNSAAANQENATGVWDSNFKGVWHMDSTSWVDSTGNNANGSSATYGGGTAPSITTSGLIGSATTFSGSSTNVGGYVTIANAAAQNFSTGSYTVSFWVQMNSSGYGWNQYYVNKYDGGNVAGYHLSFAGTYDGASKRFWMMEHDADSGSGHDKFSDAGKTLNNTNWHYLTYVRDTSTSPPTRYMYFDGVAPASPDTTTANMNVSNTSQPLLFGARIGTSSFHAGIMDEIQMSNSARSGGWILAQYNNQNAPATFSSAGSEDSTFTWDGSSSTDWDTAANWDVNAVPGAGHTVIIPDVSSGSNRYPVLGSNTTVTNLTINANASLTLSGRNLTVSSTFTNNGTLTLQGDETTVSTPTLNSGSTVEYTATSGNRNIKDWTYTNATVKINGAGGTFELPGDKACAALNVAAGIFGLRGQSLTVSGTTTVGAGGSLWTTNGNLNANTINNSGNIYLNAPSTTSTISLDNGTTFTNSGVVQVYGSTFTCTLQADAGSTATFSGTDIDYNGKAITLSRLTYNPAVALGASESITLGGDVTFASTITLNGAGAAFTTGANNLTLSATGTPLTVTTGTFTNTGGTVTYTGATTATTIAQVVYNNLTLTPAAAAATTYSLAGSLDSASGKALTGNLTINNGATLDAVNGSNFNLSAVNITINTGGIYTARASTITASGNWDSSGGTFTYGTSTVTLTGSSGTQTVNVGSNNLYNVTINNTGTSVQVVTNNVTQATGGALAFTRGTLDLNGKTWTLGAAFAPAPTAAAVLNLSTASSVLTGSGYNFTLSNADMTITQGVGTITVQDYSQTLGTHTISGALNTRDFSHAGGTFTSSATTTITASGNVVITSAWTNTGSTIVMTGTTKTINASQAINNLTTQGSISIATNNLNVDGNFYLDSNTFSHNSLDMNVAGNFTIDSGTTYTTGGTLTFDGTGTQSITSNSNSFNNLTVTNNSNIVTFADAFTTSNLTATTASTRLNFTAGATYVVSGTLSMNGQAAGTEIQLRSTVSGTRYTLNVTGGAQAVSYVDVKDSNASGNDITASNSINTGNNDNAEASPHWVFGAVTRYWVGTASGEDWDDNNNWSSASNACGVGGGANYPQAGDTAVFNNCDNNITLDASVSAAAITNTGGYTGTFTTSNNTITLTGSFQWDAGTFTAGSSTINVAGNWDSSAGIFTASTSTVTFNGGGTSTLVSGGSSFSTLTVSNNTTLRPQTSALTAATLNVTSGTLDMATNDIALSVTGTLTISASQTYNTGTNNQVISTLTNNGNVVCEGAGANGSNLQITTFTNNDGSLWTYTNTGAATIKQGTYHDLTLNDSGGPATYTLGTGTTAVTGTLTVTGGTLAIGSNTLNVTESVSNSDIITISTGTLDVDTNITVGTLTATGAATINIAGNWSGVTTFTPSTSTVTFNGSGAQSITRGGSAFNAVVVTNASAAGVTFADALSTATLTDTTNASTLKFATSGTHTVSGTLTLTGGSGANMITLAPSTAATNWNFSPPAGTTVTGVNVSYSQSDKTITANSSSNGGSNTNWSFGAVTRYWVGTNGGAWNSNSNWSTSSGGAGGFGYPAAGDTAIFDGSDTDGVTLTGNVTVAVLTMQAGYTGANAKLDANGSDITTTSTLTITGGELELDASSDLTVGGALTVNGGTLDGANGTIDANSSVTLSSGTLIAPSGNFNVAGNFAHSGGTFTNSSGTVVFDSAATAVISGDTTFNNLTCTTAGKQLTFTAGTTQTVAGTLTLTGAPGNLILLRSSASGTKWDITLSGAAQSVSLLDVQDSDANTNTVTCVNCLDSGNNNANWLFDPFGIVFDSLTNNPIQGAVVSLWYDTGGGNWILARPGIEIGAADANPQTTGAAGAYSYLTINGTFRFTITAAGYAYPSARIAFPAGRIICPGDAACSGVSGSKGETFVVAGLAIQMDHPMDGSGSLIQLTKTANKEEASVGDIITYTLSIENKTTSSITGVLIEDRIPAGFKYITDRTTLDGQNASNPTGQRPLIFDIGTIGAGLTRTLRYQLVVGSGVTFGKYENTAYARYSDGTVISNVAKEEVMIVPDPLFDLGTIIGKVFRDINENGIQDGREIMNSENQETAVSPYEAVTSTEPGIGRVNIMTEEGIVITTDKDGKYHLAGVTPGRHILRIDESTLPEGAYLTTDRAVIIDVTPGILQKVNFGVNKKELIKKPGMPAEVVDSTLREEQAAGELLAPALPASQGEPAGGPAVSEEELEAKSIDEKEYTGLKAEEPEQAPEEILTLGIPVPEIKAPAVSEEELKDKSIDEKDYTGLKAEETGAQIEEPEAEVTQPQAEISEKAAAPPPAGIIPLLLGAVSSLGGLSKDFVFVGLADIKAGYTNVSGSIEPVEQDDKFTKGFWKEGRLAYYLKGKIKGKYLITSSLDTDREKKEIFRNLDPDKYYPVYGDASTVNYDAADTQGLLYLAVEWDKSKAMWGNYNTGITDTELAQFNRSLYGAKLHYETVSVTEADKPETKIIIFHADARQKAGHNEFLGTGGSLYYLRHKPVIEGSEKVKIEIRNKDTGLVIAQIAQEEGKDYEIDYSNARIMFYLPVSQIAQSSSIISNALLDGNPLYVVVDYEYEVNAVYSKASYGGRVEQSLSSLFSSQSTVDSSQTADKGQPATNNVFLKDIRIGGTYIKDEQDTGDYRLNGLDASLYLGSHTEITAEYAETQAQGMEGFVSTDGGLTFTEIPTAGSAHGKAYSLKAKTRFFDNINLFGYYRHVGRGFSDSSTISEQGKESGGVDISWDFTDKINFRLTHDMQKLLSSGAASTTAQIGANRTDTTRLQASQKWEKLKLTEEFRHVKVSEKNNQFSTETNEPGNTAALRGDYDISKTLSVFLEQQAALDHGDEVKNDYQTTAGVSAQIFKWLKLRASSAIGSDGTAASIGTNAKVDDRTEIYNTYSLSNSGMDGRKNTIVSGGRTKVTENMDFTTEMQNTSSSKEISRTNIFGLSGEINERWGLSGSYERGMVQSYTGELSKRSAGSIGLSYIERWRIRASSKIELRLDEGQQREWQYLSYNALQWQVDRDTTLFGKINLSKSKNTTLNRTEAEYKEIVLGSAYRPVNFDDLNLLAKYTYLEDRTSAGQTDMSNIQEQRAHVLAGEAVYDLNANWQVVEKLAFKIGNEKVTGFDFTKTQTWLWINRVNYNLYRNWQIGAEYRMLVQEQAKDMKKGALIEVARNLGKSLQIGVGYNFTDFSDDLTNLDYTSQGPFIRLSAKITD